MYLRGRIQLRLIPCFVTWRQELSRFADPGKKRFSSTSLRFFMAYENLRETQLKLERSKSPRTNEGSSKAEVGRPFMETACGRLRKTCGLHRMVRTSHGACRSYTNVGNLESFEICLLSLVLYWCSQCFCGLFFVLSKLHDGANQGRLDRRLCLRNMCRRRGNFQHVRDLAKDISHFKSS